MTVVVTDSWATDGLRLVAVAPGGSVMDVVGTVTGGAIMTSQANIPHDGFGILMKRVSSNRWRAYVKFSRAGHWELVIPNGSLDGYAMPLPIDRAVTVAP